MLSNFEMLVAARYLKSKKRDKIISVIAGFSLVGVALGVAALIVVMAVMNGFHHEISLKMTGFNGDITIKSVYGNITDYDALIAKTLKNKAVTAAIPVIESKVMVSSGQYVSGAIVKATRIGDLRKRTLIADSIIAGSLEEFDDTHIVIGYKLAENLAITSPINSSLTVISAKGNITAIGMIPRTKTFDIAASFKSDMYLYDETSVFMTLDMAQLYFKLPKMVNMIEISIANRDNSQIVAQQLQQELGDELVVSDWQTSNASYFNVLKTERVVMFLILTLIILVAAFNIISSLIMLVQDKTKDIAILRTMGATSGSIMKIFLICGVAIGIIGTTIGTVLGLSFALNIESIRKLLEQMSGSVIFDPVIYYLSSLPCDVRLDDVLQIMAISLSLSLIATIYPAYKAAHQSPIEGLRYE